MNNYKGSVNELYIKFPMNDVIIVLFSIFLAKKKKKLHFKYQSVEAEQPKQLE